MRNFLIKNSTSTTIDLCKQNVNLISVEPGQTRELQMSLVTAWHGHSATGSFAICKRYDHIDFLCWGNFSLILIQNNNSTTYEIVEKTLESE